MPASSSAAAMDSAAISKIINGLSPGKSRGVMVVESEAKLGELFTNLSKDGTSATPPTYKGTMVKLPDGTTVGMRTTSTSGGPTIDVKLPNKVKIKVHVDKPK